MEDSSFYELVERYKRELMDVAKRNGMLGKTPVTAAAAAVPAEAVPAVPPAPMPTAEQPPAPQTPTMPESPPAPRETAPVTPTPVPPPIPAPTPAPPGSELPEELNLPIVNPPQTEELAPRVEPTAPFETYEQFLRRATGEGSLKIQASMANRTYPVPDVRIVVSKEFTDGLHVFYEAETDQDGIVDGLLLPAPPKELSLQPDTVTDPFSVYKITASKVGFREEDFIQVPIFDGIKSIQPVRMVPQGIQA